MKCFSCGCDKDLDKLEMYSHNDSFTQDDPIEPLLTIECQDDNGPYRMVVICHECWHRLCETIGIDMWISQVCWETLNPILPFAKLPIAINDLSIDGFDHEKWKAINYNCDSLIG
jgi:hypothetical protein